MVRDSQEKTTFPICNQGTVDFDVCDQKKCPFPHEFEKQSESSLKSTSRCEGSYNSSIQERLRFDTSDDRPACAIGGVAVLNPPALTSAQAVARIHRLFRSPPLRATSRACSSSVFEIVAIFRT